MNPNIFLSNVLLQPILTPAAVVIRNIPSPSTCTHRVDLETRRHRFIYAVDCEHEPYTGTIKVDVATREVVGRWRLQPGQYTQEASVCDDTRLRSCGYTSI